MSIYKPSELRCFLESLGVSPKKGLSQNFLIDGNILRKIVTLSNLKAGDLVLEIGPGPGSLTEMLLEAGAHVIAVEKDPVFAEALNRLQTPDKRLTIFCEDILKFPIEEEIEKATKNGLKAKVIANLPYHLTTPIFNRLIPLYTLFDTLTVMVQEEVGRRMTAIADTPAYGSLTVFLNFYCHVSYGFTVSRNCFYPAPKVDSAMVLLQLKKPPIPPSDFPVFFGITRTAFEQRRKMLRGSLKEKYSSEAVEKALQTIGMPSTARPEMLSLEQFLKLYDALIVDP